MVDLIRRRYGLYSPKILSVMLSVPREKFVAGIYRPIAYSDGPISIGYGQTMSQPYTVALMTDLLNLKGRERVLEIGTGSGYQAAILSKLAKEVFTIEIIRPLAERARKRLGKLGFKNIKVRVGSGEWGWKEKAPYDAILVTAGIGKKVPEALFDQLKENGVLLAPIGTGQNKVMTRFTKTRGKIKKEEFGTFYFVPFVQERN